MATGRSSDPRHLAELARRIEDLDLPTFESSEEVARSEVARAARHFGFAQPSFRSSLKLRFTGEGVNGNSLEGDVAAEVIGAISESVSEAGSSLRNLSSAETKLYLSPTVEAGSTILELYSAPAPSAERLDIEIDDTPVDGAIDALLDVLASDSDQLEVPGALGKKLYALSKSIIDGRVDLELTWTRPRGARRKLGFDRESARALRDTLDVDTVKTIDVEMRGQLTSISTGGEIAIVPQGKKTAVKVDARKWSPTELRTLWAENVVATWAETSTSHPMRAHVSVVRKLLTIRADAAVE